MSIDPIVRLALANDVDAIKDIDNQARCGLENQRGGAAWLAEHMALSNMSPERILQETYVGVIDDVVIAFLRVEVADVPLRGHICTVDRVFVEPEARELGFGDALLAMAQDRASEAGCHFIEGSALPGDRQTKNLYERAGIVARKIVVSKGLLPRTH